MISISNQADFGSAKILQESNNTPKMNTQHIISLGIYFNKILLNINYFTEILGRLFYLLFTRVGRFNQAPLNKLVA